jgi:hypothetical protein
VKVHHSPDDTGDSLFDIRKHLRRRNAKPEGWDCGLLHGLSAFSANLITTPAEPLNAWSPFWRQ